MRNAAYPTQDMKRAKIAQPTFSAPFALEEHKIRSGGNMTKNTSANKVRFIPILLYIKCFPD